MSSISYYYIKCIFFLVIFWLIVIGLISFLPYSSNINENIGISNYLGNSQIYPKNDIIEIYKRIGRMTKSIEQLGKTNIQIKRVLTGETIGSSDENDKGQLGSSEIKWTKYEQTRRQLERDVQELWNNIRNKGGNTINDHELIQIGDVYKQAMSNLIQLRNFDGYEDKRNAETIQLSDLIQERIYKLQNPNDCSKARKLVCVLNKGCGFGCQIHHVGYCLMVAYATSRTLILESKGWRYNRGGWEKVFMPLSDSCTNPSGSPRGDWAGGSHKNFQVLNLPIVDFLKPRPPYLPVAIPKDLAKKLERIHGEPHIFWVGQFIKYLLRLQPATNESIEITKVKLGFKSPIVGIHVRRTDKIGTEASFHSLKEYMDHAQNYFDILSNLEQYKNAPLIKRVFIASDDPTVLTEASNIYGSDDFEILGDKGVAQSASLSQRYYALEGIIKDVFLLSKCDILVCTFSSQVCRLAYEIMQSRIADGSSRFISLDDIYYYGGGIGVLQIATKKHIPRNDLEIELEEGDIIALAGNHWDGLSKGTNKRTNRMGLFPSHKVKSTFQRIQFPTDPWW